MNKTGKLRMKLLQHEKRIIREAVKRLGSPTAAAKDLGISRQGLWVRMNRK